MIRNIRKISVDGERIVIKKVFSKTTIDVADITRIRVSRVLSLVDEVGIQVVTPQHQFVYTDADEWFEALSKALKLDDLFGEYWLTSCRRG